MGKNRKKARKDRSERLLLDQKRISTKHSGKRTASSSSSDDAPSLKRRKESGEKHSPQPQDVDGVSRNNSIQDLIKSVEEGKFSRLSKAVEVTERDTSVETSAVSEGISDVTSENDQRVNTDCSTPSTRKQTPKVPKSEVKAYGMPNVIKGKIIGETDTSIYLKLRKSITICGKMSVRAVKGTVKVAGYEMQASGRKYPVYSPNCYALLTISVIDTNKVNVKGVCGDIKKKIVQWDENCAVLELSKLECSKSDFVTSFEKNKHVYLSPGYPLPVVETRIITDRLPTLLEDPVHKEAADGICQLIATGSTPIIMLCGGKNAGKSTFCRYLLNRALSVKGCDEVDFLECDVGQTEFTPSSLVSLSTVTAPLLGPPFTHHAWPHSSVFYGYASPEKDAEGYMECVRKMFDVYTNRSKEVPLIVNTMGWNKGLGLRLFIDTLRLTQATHIIQIDHPSEGRNFPDMTADFIEVSNGFETHAGEKSHHETIHIPSLLNLQTEGIGKFTPKDHRNLIFFSYFGASLAKTVPYEVPWGAITVLLNNSLTTPAQILHLLNGSVVGLCVLPERPVHTAPQVLERNKCGPPLCKGLGIVRSIDPERRVFHVITPLPLAQLVDVNCFKVGSLAIIEQLITTQKLTEALPKTIPFFGEYRDTAGSSKVAKPRHMMRGKKM